MTPPLTREQIENLLRLAEMATPGPWYSIRYDGEFILSKTHTLNSDNAYEQSIFNFDSGKVSHQEDRTYVAATHPETIKSLCTEIFKYRNEEASLICPSCGTEGYKKDIKVCSDTIRVDLADKDSEILRLREALEVADGALTYYFEVFEEDDSKEAGEALAKIQSLREKVRNEIK